MADKRTANIAVTVWMTPRLAWIPLRIAYVRVFSKRVLVFWRNRILLDCTWGKKKRNAL